MSTEKKAALEGILIMMMHSGNIKITVGAVFIIPAFDHVAKANIIDTSAMFCDMAEIMANALDSLSGNKDLMECLLDSSEKRDTKKSELFAAIDAFVESCLWEDFTETFNKDEMQAILRKHPKYEDLAAEDARLNPPTTDFYNAGESGFTA